MPIFLLKMFASPILRKILPWIGGALLIGIATVVIVHKWDHFKQGLINQGIDQGKKQEDAKFTKLVADNNKVNRKVEQQVGGALDGFSQKVDQMLQRLNTAESKVAGNINTQINAHPEIFNNRTCDVPQAVIDSRNQIRHLGPKDGPVSSPAVTGSSVTVKLD